MQKEQEGKEVYVIEAATKNRKYRKNTTKKTIEQTLLNANNEKV